DPLLRPAAGRKALRGALSRRREDRGDVDAAHKRGDATHLATGGDFQTARRTGSRLRVDGRKSGASHIARSGSRISCVRRGAHTDRRAGTSAGERPSALALTVLTAGS